MHSKVGVGSGMGGWDKNLKRVVGISKDQRIKSTFVESLLPSSGELVTNTNQLPHSPIYAPIKLHVAAQIL